MRTTTRSSEPSRAALAVLLAGLGLTAACASGPRTTSQGLFVLAPDSAAHKAMETRYFETADRDELLSASAAALQDLGFQVTESDRTLGFLRAAKERSAREYGQEVERAIVAFFSTLLSGLSRQNGTVIMPVDLQQQINASMIASPVGGDEGRYEVRVVFYRLVWKGDGANGDQSIAPGEQRMEMLRDAEIYQRFFARLSKSIFLEAEKI